MVKSTGEQPERVKRKTETIYVNVSEHVKNLATEKINKLGMSYSNYISHLILKDCEKEGE